MSEVAREVKLTEPERARYSRQIMLPSCGEEGQLKLKSSSVLVIGAGGLGCAVLTALVEAGVGRVTVFDFDHVSVSNLHRQPLYTERDVGSLKVEVAQRRLRELNPHVEVKICASPLLAPHALEPSARSLLLDIDLIVDCVDRFDARLTVARYAQEFGVPHCYGAVTAESGQVALFEPGQACLRCLFPTLPGGGVIASCDQGGVLGSAPQLIGSMQATLALNYLTRGDSQGCQDTIARAPTTLTQVSLSPLSFYQLKVERRADCKLCSQLEGESCEQMTTTAVPISSVGARELFERELHPSRPVLTLDVREPHEHNAGALPNALNLPLAELERACDERDETLLAHLRSGDVLVYCERGPRAERAAASLARLSVFDSLSVTTQPRSTIYELVGGYRAWVKSLA